MTLNGKDFRHNVYVEQLNKTSLNIKRKRQDLNQLEAQARLLRARIEIPQGKTFEAFTGEISDNKYLRGLYVTTIPNDIYEDIETPFARHNNYGIFLNRDGNCVELYENTSCGVYFFPQKGNPSELILKAQREIGATNDCRLGGIYNYNVFDEQDMAKLSLMENIITLMELGYYYILKRTPEGESQYKKS